MQIVHYNTFQFLRYGHFRYAKCLFTNIEKQQDRKLKSSPLKKKKKNWRITREFLGFSMRNFQGIISL